MTLSPVKTCDHCGKMGIMPTFSDGETICAECNFSLPISSRECRREIVKLRKAIEAMRIAGGSVEFQAAFDRAKELINWRRNRKGEE